MIEQLGRQRPTPVEATHKGASSGGLRLAFPEHLKVNVVPGVLDTLVVQSDRVRFTIMSLLDESDSGIRHKELVVRLHEAPNLQRNTDQPLSPSSVSHLLGDLRERKIVRRNDSPTVLRDPEQLTPYGKEAMRAYDEYSATIKAFKVNPLLEQARASLGEDLYIQLLAQIEGLRPDEENGLQTRPFSTNVASVMAAQGDPFRLGILLALDRNPSGVMTFRPVLEAVKTGLNKVDVAPSTLSNAITELEGKRLLARRSGEYALTNFGKMSLQAFQKYHDRLVEPLVEYWRQVTEEKFGVKIPVKE